MDSFHCHRRTFFAVAVVLILGTVFRLWRKTKRTFEANVAKVVHLYVYPIKSVPGIEVDKATITRDGGLEYKNILKDRFVTGSCYSCLFMTFLLKSIMMKSCKCLFSPE